MKKLTIAKKIIKRIEENGFQAYLVGGCVRDHLLELPVKDYDIATNAPPKAIERLFKRTIAVGAQFGVMIVNDQHEQFEVATFRKDREYADGRHPDHVEFSNIEEDAKRRDLTINGLYMHPETMEIIDLVGGRQDLEDRVIRAIGVPEERFEEDYLRILRAIRFCAYLHSRNFYLEDATKNSIHQFASRLTSISAERIRDELTKMFTCPHPGFAMDMLLEHDILPHILPELIKLKGLEQPPEFHPEGDVWEHTKLAMNIAQPKTQELAWAVLLHDIGKPLTISYADRIRFNGHCQTGAEITEAILDRFRFSKQQIQSISHMVRNHMAFINVPNMRQSKLKRFMSSPEFEEEMKLHRADCLSSHGDLSILNFLKEKQKQFSEEDLKPDPLVMGRDLIQLGYKPGPLFKEIIRWVYDLQLEDEIQTKEQALTFIQEKYPIKSDEK